MLGEQSVHPGAYIVAQSGVGVPEGGGEAGLGLRGGHTACLGLRGGHTACLGNEA